MDKIDLVELLERTCYLLACEFKIVLSTFIDLILSGTKCCKDFLFERAVYAGNSIIPTYAK